MTTYLLTDLVLKMKLFIYIKKIEFALPYVCYPRHKNGIAYQKYSQLCKNYPNLKIQKIKNAGQIELTRSCPAKRRSKVFNFQLAGCVMTNQVCQTGVQATNSSVRRLSGMTHILYSRLDRSMKDGVLLTGIMLLTFRSQMVSFDYIVQSFSVRIPIQKKPVVELLCENPL